MSEVAQIILAVGFAAFLILIASVGVIWSLRCNSRSEQYRFPLLLGASIPLLIAGAVVFERLS